MVLAPALAIAPARDITCYSEQRKPGRGGAGSSVQVNPLLQGLSPGVSVPL